MIAVVRINTATTIRLRTTPTAAPSPALRSVTTFLSNSFELDLLLPIILKTNRFTIAKKS